MEDKILIVGAGISGLSCAWFLRKKGYKNITILEQNNYIGGKCRTININNSFIDLGAIIGCNTYYELIKILKELKIKVPKTKLDSVYFKNNKKINKLFLNEKFPYSLAFIPQIIKLGFLLKTKYKNYDKAGHANLHPDLKLSFIEFCQKNKIDKIPMIYACIITAYGYGYLDEVPASYVFKCLPYSTLIAMLSQNYFLLNEKGAQFICEKMSEGFDVRLSEPALTIDRVNKILISKKKVYKYDKIIITSPLHRVKQFLELNSLEKTLFEKIVYEDYQTKLYKSDNPTANSYNLNLDKLNQENKGQTMCYIDKDGIITAYSYKNNLDDKYKPLNIKVSWEMFPHVSCANMQINWYEKMESIQGKDGIYYAGEIMDFSILERCILYSKNLVERFFREGEKDGEILHNSNKTQKKVS